MLALAVAFGHLDEKGRARLAHATVIPLLVSMVGLVASATHLGTPANALYVLTGVGRSPLSNEVERVKDLARRRKKQRVNHIAAVVSLVTGIIAVAACAAVVYLATDGAGLGYRPEPQGRTVLPAPSVTAPPDEGATADSVGDADEPGTADDAGETGGADAAGNPAAPTPDAPAQPPADTEAATPPAGETAEEPATPTPPADEGAGDASTGDTDTGEGAEPEEDAADAGDGTGSDDDASQ